MPTTQSIIINLDQLRALLKEYVAEQDGNDSLLKQLTLSQFLIWAERKVNDGQEKRPLTRISGLLRYPQR